MKIHIEQIPDSGLELNESYDAQVLDLARADIKFSEPINLSARIVKGTNHISAQLKVEAQMHVNCSRCLEEFIQPLAKKINLNLPIEGKQEVDLTDNVREEIMLNYPLQVLCKPECLGLCATCGQNLNKGRCKHAS